MALDIQTCRFSSGQTAPPGGDSDPGGFVGHGSTSAVELSVLHGHKSMSGPGGWSLMEGQKDAFERCIESHFLFEIFCF